MAAEGLPEKRRKKKLRGGDAPSAFAAEAPVSGKIGKKKKIQKMNKAVDSAPQGSAKVTQVINSDKQKKKKKKKGKLKEASAAEEKSGGSMKSKKLNFNLQGPKLHELTNAPCVGVVAKVDHSGVRTGATNDNIWQDPETQDNSDIADGLQGFLAARGVADLPRISPGIEAFRARCAYKSRQHLRTLLKQPPPLVSWERWQANCKLTEYLAAVRGRKESNLLDPLLPENSSLVEAGLVSDLQRCSGNINAKGIARGMVTHSAQLAKLLRARAEKGQEDPAEKVVVEGHKHSYDVYLKSDKKRLLKLNTQHYKKLRKMYGESRSEKLFNDDLYLMLSRYHALCGHGMQSALPEQVFGLLHKTLGCDFECFASPLNARYAKFCSAFHDVDNRFGAIGDFFSVTTARLPEDSSKPGVLRQWMLKSGGSYQLNPPFIKNVLRQAAIRVEELLEASVKEAKPAPLSFVIFIPGWKESDAFQKLQRSKFLTKSVVIAAKEHGYVSGAQHQRKDRYMDSPFDTVVLVLQNASGKAKWSVAGSFEEDLRKAFAMGIPTEAMRERRLKEGRGYSDLDGGGGVYKGKKKKQKEEAAAAEGGDEAAQAKDGAKDNQKEQKQSGKQSRKEASWWKRKKQGKEEGKESRRSKDGKKKDGKTQPGMKGADASGKGTKRTHSEFKGRKKDKKTGKKKGGDFSGKGMRQK